jgi:hypothetical protein
METNHVIFQPLSGRVYVYLPEGTILDILYIRHINGAVFFFGGYPYKPWLEKNSSSIEDELDVLVMAMTLDTFILGPFVPTVIPNPPERPLSLHRSRVSWHTSRAVVAMAQTPAKTPMSQ